MLQQLTKLTQRNKGFTLLEMLVVIVIIGILATILVPGLASGPQRARDAQRKADMRSTKNSLETYYSDNNKYPSVASTVGSAAYGLLSTPLVTGYLSTLPADPKNSGQYVYMYLQKDATSSSSLTLACLETGTDNSGTTNSGTAPVPTYTGVQTTVDATACGAHLYVVQTVN